MKSSGFKWCRRLQLHTGSCHSPAQIKVTDDLWPPEVSTSTVTSSTVTSSTVTSSFLCFLFSVVCVRVCVCVCVCVTLYSGEQRDDKVLIRSELGHESHTWCLFIKVNKLTNTTTHFESVKNFPEETTKYILFYSNLMQFSVEAQWTTSSHQHSTRTIMEPTGSEKVLNKMNVTINLWSWQLQFWFCENVTDVFITMYFPSDIPETSCDSWHVQTGSTPYHLSSLPDNGSKSKP